MRVGEQIIRDGYPKPGLLKAAVEHTLCTDTLTTTSAWDVVLNRVI